MTFPVLSCCFLILAGIPRSAECNRIMNQSGAPGQTNLRRGSGFGPTEKTVKAAPCRLSEMVPTRFARHETFRPLSQLRHCWGGLSSTTMVSGREREHANQALETFRPVGISYLGDRGRSAGVPERNLDRSLETLLLFHNRSCVRRHYCLPRGALGCDCGHRDVSSFPGLAHCRARCPEAADTTIQARCLNRIAAAACTQRATHRAFRFGTSRHFAAMRSFVAIGT